MSVIILEDFKINRYLRYVLNGVLKNEYSKIITYYMSTIEMRRCGYVVYRKITDYVYRDNWKEIFELALTNKI